MLNAVTRVVRLPLILSLLLSFNLALAQVISRVETPTFTNAPNPALIPEEIIRFDNTKWDHAIGPNGQYKFKRTFQFAPQAPLSGIGKKTFDDNRDVTTWRVTTKDKATILVPEGWEGAVLGFEGIHFRAKVHVNGQLLSGKDYVLQNEVAEWATRHNITHDGGYSGFELDVSRHLAGGKKVPGGTEIEIEVVSEADYIAADIEVGKQERFSLWHVKQDYEARMARGEIPKRPDGTYEPMPVKEGAIFYENMVGPWKPGYLRRVNPQAYFAQVKLFGGKTKLLRGQILVNGKASGLEARVVMTDPKSKRVVYEFTAPVVNGRVDVVQFIPGARNWTLDDPKRYHYTIDLMKDGKRLARVRSKAGFYEFAQKDGHFWMNGVPRRFKLQLNQHYENEGFYTSSNRERFRKQNQLMIDMGFDGERTHATTMELNQADQLKDGFKRSTDGQVVGALSNLESQGSRNNLPDSNAPFVFYENRAEATEAFFLRIGELTDYHLQNLEGRHYDVLTNEDWGFLEDHGHWANQTPEKREMMQWKAYDAWMKKAPRALQSDRDLELYMTYMEAKARGLAIRDLPSQYHDPDTHFDKADFLAHRVKHLVKEINPLPKPTSQMTPAEVKALNARLAGYRPTAEDIANAIPISGLAAPGDGWRVVTAFKRMPNGKIKMITNPYRVVVASHYYPDHAHEITAKFNLPSWIPLGYEFPRLSDYRGFLHEFYVYPGSKYAAFILSEYGGAGHSFPGDPDYWCYRPIDDYHEFKRVVLEQMKAAAENPAIAMDVYTEGFDAGQEKNGIYYADGKSKHPSGMTDDDWRRAFAYMKARREKLTLQAFEKATGIEVKSYEDLCNIAMGGGIKRIKPPAKKQ